MAADFEMVSQLGLAVQAEGTCSRIMTAVEATKETEVVFEATATANFRVKPKARSWVRRLR